jgi:hypothetical protein
VGRCPRRTGGQGHLPLCLAGQIARRTDGHLDRRRPDVVPALARPGLQSGEGEGGTRGRFPPCPLWVLRRGRGPLLGPLAKKTKTRFVSNFAQTRSPALCYWRPFAICVGGLPMYTSAECRTQAEEKLARAKHDNQHRNRLIAAAEAWLFLASQLRRSELALVPIRRPRRTTAWWIEPSA